MTPIQDKNFMFLIPINELTAKYQQEVGMLKFGGIFIKSMFNVRPEQFEHAPKAFIRMQRGAFKRG